MKATDIFSIIKYHLFEERFELLIQEGLNRGIDIQEDTMSLYDKKVDYSILKNEKVLKMMIHDYKPTPDEQQVNLDRVLLRIQEKFDAGNQLIFIDIIKTF